MKLLSLIESTKLKVSEDQSYDDLRVAKYLCRLDNKKFSGYGRISKYISRAEDLRNDENDKYKSILRQPSPSSDDSWASANLNLKEKAPSDAIWGIFANGKDITARYSSSAEAKKAAANLQQKNPNTKYEVKKADPEKIEEGEERSIIQSGCVEKLVDEFRGEEHQFENRSDLEYAIYSELERLDVEDCVDPDMEHGGQRMGDFASGGVLNVIDSSSVIDDVIEQLDTSDLEEGIFDKHSYDPPAPGGQSSKRKNLHATGDIVSLDGKEYVVTKVDLNKGTIDVVDRDGNRSPNVKAGVFSPGIKVGDKKADFYNTGQATEGKSPHKKGTKKYKKHMAAMHAEAKDPRTSDADQIIKQIIDGYGIDNLEDVFRQYYPQLSDEQVEKFLSKHKKPELRLIKNEQVAPLKKANSPYNQAIQYFLDKNPNKSEEDFKNLSMMQQNKYLDKFIPEDADINDNMIGEPDNYYDAEERQEAHKDLQDALQGNYMDDYIIDGDCPACGGSGYMDGEETFTNDDGEEEESSECDGFGNFGCDEGEMTYGSDGPSWVEIIKHDKRQADRRDAVANYPGDEKVISQIANMVKNMEDPRMAMQQMAVDYPQMGRRQRAELVSKGMKKAGLTGMGENMNENKWKEIETNSDYMLPVTMNNEPLDWPTYWEWEQSHGETNKNKASLRFGNYVADAKHELSMAEGEQHGNSKIYKKCWTGYSKVPGKKAGEKGSCKKNEGRIEDTFGTDTVDKHDKPKKKKKEESIQAGDELMIETADGEGIVVPVLHVVDENILVGWDELAEDIVVEGARQLEELRKLAGIEITEDKNCGCGQDPCKTYGKIKEAEYQGRKVKLGKPTRGDVKKFKVYVKDPKTGNVKKVNFGHGGSSAKKAGQKTMKIKKSNPARRKSFRARHNCDNPGPRTKARYWSCRAW